MQTRKKRLARALSLVLSLLMLLTVAAGCGRANEQDNNGTSTPATKAKTGNEQADGPVPITMWGWNAGEIEKIVDAYIKLTNANISLDYVTVQQMEAFQKLQTTINAGLDMPDIVPSEINQRGTMMSLDIWEDLSKEPFNFDESLTFDYFMPLCKNEKGELVCLPYDVSTAALAYKKEMAKQYLGTDDPEELQKMLPDWDTFKKVGLGVRDKSDGKIFMFASLTNVKQIIDGQNPAPIIKDNVLDMDSSVRKTVTRMVDFRDSGIVDNIIESSPAYNASYAERKHIFYPCASWSPNYVITPNDPDGVDAWGLMIPPEGCFSWGGSGFMIPRKALHKQEAFNLISWFLTEEGTKSQRETVRFNISNRQAYDDPEFAKLTEKSFGDQNLGQILFVEAMKNINVRPVSVHDVVITDTFNLVTEAINNDRTIGVDGALEMIETELRNKIPDLK
ncbi:ABC transporter substrate-binding protein [Ruminiclostridium cellobioparum]|uniref:ABC transporter substrate-binding protein n=1 Tax=Ruminiclostridium cellobioparum TaxID=29355 RepID=UPI0028AF4C9F|nr:extracellular solute-binding protein [Ruminiclostridium cellobioparum]